MKIFFAILVGIMILCIHGFHSLKEKHFKKERFQIISNLLSNGLVATEMAALRESSKIRCTFECTKLEGCRAFVYGNDRCILIGNDTLPGVSVALQTDEPMDAYGNSDNL